MPIKAKPAQFVASDGKEFASQKEAEAHQELIESASKFDAARRRFYVAVAESQKTADGVPFDLNRWQDYYVLCRHGYCGPGLRRIMFGYTTRIELSGDANDQVQLIVMEDANQGKTASFFISDLYFEKEAAHAALAQAIREHIAEKQEELKKLEAGTWR